MYYLQVYGFYEEVQVDNVEDVQLTSVVSGESEAILYENFKAIDADTNLFADSLWSLGFDATI